MSKRGERVPVDGDDLIIRQVESSEWAETIELILPDRLDLVAREVDLGDGVGKTNGQWFEQTRRAVDAVERVGVVAPASTLRRTLGRVGTHERGGDERAIDGRIGRDLVRARRFVLEELNVRHGAAWELIVVVD